MLPRDQQTIVTAGVYYAGRITERTGAMVQYSRDGIERRWGGDGRPTVCGLHDGRRRLDPLFGVTLNNAPTLTDVWTARRCGAFRTSTPPV